MRMLSRLDERDDLSPEEEALAEVLTLLIEDYEERHHPLPRASPNESLQALMEERKDIWPVLGNKGAATEVLFDATNGAGASLPFQPVIRIESLKAAAPKTYPHPPD